MTFRRFALGLIILFSLISTPFALAHDGVMFEFSPDAWNSKRHTVASAATPFQYFQPASDFSLTGFDFWMDNTGSSGNITFTLYDDQNTILGEKTITIASTGAIAGGMKKHVDLDEGVTLSRLKVYSIQISSTLLGLGLYYSDRLTLLEHNLPFATEYSNGVAYLGSAPQSYTFKFALYSPSVSGSEEEPSSEEEPVTPPPSPLLVAIQNARVVAATHNAVTIAWSTTVAADSRMSVRQQTNPLYVLASSYDPTLELEHTLTVSSLTPSTCFFADLASLQDPNATTTLVTTLSFNTTAAPPTPPTPPVPPVVPPTPPTPPATPPTTPPATPATPPAPPGEETPPPATPPFSPSPSPSGTTPPPPGEGTNLSSPDIETGAEGSLTVSWNPGASEEPVNGYRVDIFDASHHLVRTVNVPTGTHSYETGLLANEDHTVIVYANNNGVFTKIVRPVVVEITEGINPITWFWIGLIAAVLATIGIAKFAFGREKTELTPLE